MIEKKFRVVTVHRYPVNVTAYARLKSPAAMGHMFWLHNRTGPWLIRGMISHGVNSNLEFSEIKRGVLCYRTP